jgi:hypothetical protein
MSKISRREFVESTGAGLVIATAVPLSGQDHSAAPHTTVKILVNGSEHRTEVEDRWTLVEFLRDRLGLTGTKIGCDRGECGACTVLLDASPFTRAVIWRCGPTGVRSRRWRAWRARIGFTHCREPALSTTDRSAVSALQAT